MALHGMVLVAEFACSSSMIPKISTHRSQPSDGFGHAVQVRLQPALLSFNYILWHGTAYRMYQGPV